MHTAAAALDGNSGTWWEAAPGHDTATLVLKLPTTVSFDVVSLQEAVDRRGQRIEAFFVDVWDGSGWKQMDAQTTVGHKRLLRWNAPITTDRVRIRITEARFPPTLTELALFKQAEFVKPPVISERSANGTITLACANGLNAVYTTDGSIPAPHSAAKGLSIALPRGGDVYAACIAPDGRIGVIASKRFPGFAPAGWTVVAEKDAEPGEGSVAKAIDGDPVTRWQEQGLPRTLTVNMGRPLNIGGLAYLPRRDGSKDGIVDTFRFETSSDGEHWQTVIAEGRFGNIENNPIAQETMFVPVTARFFRFTALTAIGGYFGVSAAEIAVLPAPVNSIN
jgi:alpha-L-fucosidase